MLFHQSGHADHQARLQDYEDIVRDIQQNTLPQVVFYKPIGQFDQHPGAGRKIMCRRHAAIGGPGTRIPLMRNSLQP